MAGASATIAAFALCYAGLSAISLATNRHHQQVLKPLPSKLRAGGLRATGWTRLVLSLVCCAIGWGASVGAVVWFGVLSTAALILVFLLPYAPGAIVHAAMCAAAVGVLALAWAIRA